jgi:hypothetical protein
MKVLVEEITVNEDWKQNVAAGLIGASLLTAPAVATASQHHSKPKSSVHRGLHHQTYSEKDIIRSIAGEQSGDYQGMVAVACAIRNKMKHPYYKNNILHGVAGKHAKHLANEPAQTFELARKAWNESATKDITGGAYLWGYSADIAKWKAEAQRNPKFWFNNVEPTVTIGGNTFLRDKRK